MELLFVDFLNAECEWKQIEFAEFFHLKINWKFV